MDMNNVSFTGRLGAEPETRYTPNGTTVVNFSLAVDKRKRRGEDDKKPNWFRVTAFGAQAETLANLANQGALRKGSRVGVIGELEIDEWTGNDGTPKTTVKIAANSVILLDGRNDSVQQGSSGSGARDYAIGEVVDGWVMTESGWKPVAEGPNF